MNKKKIMFFCDQELTSYLLSNFLQAHHFEIILAANKIWDIVRQIPHQTVDGVLIEARRVSLNGMKELTVIKGEFPELPTAILSASTNPTDILNALNMGADGYLLKNTMSEDFIKDFESVCNGNICISRELIGSVLHSMRHTGQLQSNPLFHKLSAREHEIMALMASGESNREIAEHMALSINTINNHIANIYKKLGVHNRVSAVSLWENSFGSA